MGGINMVFIINDDTFNLLNLIDELNAILDAHDADRCRKSICYLSIRADDRNTLYPTYGIPVFGLMV